MNPCTFESNHLGTRIRVLFGCSENSDCVVPPELLKEAAQAAFTEAARIENQFSRFRPDSQIGTLNASTGNWTPISEELLYLLRFGQNLWRLSAGAFDLRVLKELTSWGYGNAASAGVTEMSLTPSSDSRKMACFEEKKTDTGLCVLLHAPVELGGLGKGYALDQMAKALRAALAEMEGASIPFLLDAGGDLWSEGEPATPWRIALEHPLDENAAIGEVHLTGRLALAGSSPLRRHWKNGSETRHHLVDPRTQKPADQMMGVFVQSSTALEADAFATTLFVMGFDAAREFLNSIQKPPHLEALLISPRGEFFKTASFTGTLYS